MTLRVNVATADSQERLDELAAVVRRHCPINLVLRGAGVPLEETWIAIKP